jgi:hypothetical protein
MGATEAGVPTTKFDHRMLSNDPTADHVTGGVMNREPPIRRCQVKQTVAGNGPGLGFENSDNLRRGYNPSWFAERRKLDNAQPRPSLRGCQATGTQALAPSQGGELAKVGAQLLRQCALVSTTRSAVADPRSCRLA